MVTSYSPSLGNNQCAAAGSQRQAVDVSFLRDVGLDAIGFAARLGHAADGESADFLRRRDVTIQKCGRKVADGDVVETVAFLIGRQPLVHGDIQRQQVADHVAVFDPGQAPECVRAAGVRIFSRMVVQC
jgi:hypothetical protein